MRERSVEPLLNTKMFIPQARSEAVRRARLVAQLNAGLERALVLVSAPAGSGKTTALVQWVAQLPMPVAWLSLDEEDNDPTRFFAYLGAALRGVVDEPLPAALGSPEPGPLEPLLTGLVNAIAAGRGEFALVLDDYHAIRSRPIHEALAFLVDHMPPQLHLVIATRTDPPLPLARLRGQLRLAEVRAADLRFTADEAAAFLRQAMGLSPTDEDIAVLQARTEGWIVGLQLAALSLQGRDDVAGFVAAFAGSHRYILDYLTDEVLRRQPEAVQTFLLRTAILDHLCGPLCDALLDGPEREAGGEGAQATLEYLERNNLFIVPLDDERRWYRYHHLFADLLRHQLERLHPELLPELHRRAGLWHEQQGLVSGAIRHALQAGDGDRAAGLVQSRAFPLLLRGEMLTVLGWLTALPARAAAARPWLSVYHAWILALTGHPDAIEPHLQAAESRLQGGSVVDAPNLRGHIAAIRAYAAAHLDDAACVVALAREALALLPESELAVRSVVSYTLGVAYILAGDPGAACDALAEAGRLGQASGNLHMGVPAICALGDQQMALGKLHEAAQTFRSAMALAAGPDGKPLPLAARALGGLGELCYEWNDLETARRYAQESVAMGERWGNSEALVRTPPVLAQVLLAQGDIEGAHRAMRQADEVMRRFSPSQWAVSRVDAGWVRLWLAPVGGDPAKAARWAEARLEALRADAELPAQREKEYLALARVLAAQGGHGEALGLLGRLRADAEAAGRLGRMVEMLVLEAAAHAARGEAPAAHAAIERALGLAEPEGYVRTFVDEGAAVAALLSEVAGDRRSPHAAYAQRLLVAMGVAVDRRGQAVSVASAEPWQVEPLSERELEVLQAMALGLSNAEVAARLYIAISTVKRHINHIFAKLGVSNRTQAFIRARELGLL